MSETPSNEHRKHAARLANQARAAQTPSAWFEPFYAWTQGESALVPWADLAPHPLLTPFQPDHHYAKVAVVGCGLGDDAHFIAPRSQSVWAFDVAPTAIEWAQSRFPDPKITFEVADLFALPTARLGTFDLVIEIFTLQALPPESRPAASAALASLLAPGGQLVIITRTRAPEDELGPVPWPLLPEELDHFRTLGLIEEERTPAPNSNEVRNVWRRPKPQ